MKTRAIGLAFGAFLLMSATAVGWITYVAFRVDAVEEENYRRAALEEKVRLALWRLDTALLPIIHREGSWPDSDYSAFCGVKGAYGFDGCVVPDNGVVTPSRLLIHPPPEVLVHFRFGVDGVTSPQLPSGRLLELATTELGLGARIEAASRYLRALQQKASFEELLALLPAETAPREQPAPTVELLATAPPPGGNLLAQSALNNAEWEARQQQVLQATSNRAAPRELRSQPFACGDLTTSGGVVHEGPVKCFWLEGLLILARRLRADGRDWVQGCVLDWEAIHDDLLSNVQNLLPECSLEPAGEAASADGARLLASLPVRLVPGPVPIEPRPHASSIRLSLVTAWASVLVASLAMLGLFVGAISLSERRGAFVSAVTHELRTPLTTFRMYTEMLQAGMIRDEAKKQQYVAKLHSEADRLGHLVENVLAYARLEKGHDASRETLSLGTLLERVRGRLEERSRESAVELECHVEPKAREAVVSVDVPGVERILYNLVDNACKYAASGNGGILCQARLEGTNVFLTVRDHGPGICEVDAKRLFKPFAKSAREAAHSAPGVGLGLSLSRRLAREMGGDLMLLREDGKGACFVVRLPRVV